MTRLVSIRTALGCATLAMAGASHAVSYDATSDFVPDPAAANPNGVWTYGYDAAAISGYALTVFDSYLNDGDFAGWLATNYNASNTPSLFKNISGSAAFGIPAGAISLHPGPVPDGDAAILRFTAPFSGSYAIDADFFAGNTGETVASIVRNGDAANPVASLGATSSNPGYNATVVLAAGDTFDFVVGNAGDYAADSTPLTVQISAVPEPSAALLGAVGAVGIAVLLARRRRVQSSTASRVNA